MGIYGEYNVPFNGSGQYPANASIILTRYHWWIPQLEIPLLIIIILLGLIGNISIIGAIAVEKKLKFAGNAFIVNLAAADLIVTAYILPGVLADVIMNRNMFLPILCSFNAIILSVSSIASMYSLMLVSINRYIAVAHNTKYTTVFSNRNIAGMIVAVWIWSFVVTLPPAFGWGDYRYHKKIHVCMYDCNAEKYLSFTITYVCVSIVLPFVVTCFCYFGVFKTFGKQSRKIRSMTESQINSSTIATYTTRITKKKSARPSRERRERRLVMTLLAAVVLFTICWIPYALIILINHNAAAFFKRSAAWLAFTNSAMNSILYGVLNRNFRNGYKKLWGRAFTTCGNCKNMVKKMTDKSTNSEALYAITKEESRMQTVCYEKGNLTNIATLPPSQL